MVGIPYASAMEPPLPLVAGLPSGEQIASEFVPPAPGSVAGPLVSCLMVSRGDRPAVAHAITCYRAQTYANRELVILCDRPGNVIEPLLAGLDDPTIHYHFVDPAPLGTLRNLAVARAKGELLCNWDDDDLCHPRRIDLQVAALAGGEAMASFIMRWMIWWPAARRLAVSSRRCWEGSILFRRAVEIDYPPLPIGEDRAAVEGLRTRHKVVAIDAPAVYCYIVHGANTCPTDHFDLLYANATRRFEGADYDAVLAQLAQTMPIEAYSISSGRDEAG